MSGRSYAQSLGLKNYPMLNKSESVTLAANGAREEMRAWALTSDSQEFPSTELLLHAI